MERVKLDNKRILFNLLPAHVAQHFLMSNPRNMVSGHSLLLCRWGCLRPGAHPGGPSHHISAWSGQAWPLLSPGRPEA